MFEKLSNEELRYKFLVPNRESHFIPIGDLVGNAYDNLAHPPEGVRMPCFPYFDSITKGFRPREFSILCGSTGVGKTTFIANLSAELLRQNVSHYVASVETGPLDFTRRIISVFANEDLNTGDPIPKDKLFSLHRRFGSQIQTDKIQLALYENRTKVEELIHDITDAHTRFGARLAFIDNLNFFMEVTRAGDTNLEMDRVIHELVIFCKQIDIHVVMVMHPKKNQTNSRDTRVESEFEIKGSALAVQEAHNVFLLNRPRPDDVDAGLVTPLDRELKIAKMRRMGKAIGQRVIFKSDNGVRYFEKGKIG